MNLVLPEPPESAIEVRRNAMWRKIRRDHPAERLRRAAPVRLRRATRGERPDPREPWVIPPGVDARKYIERRDAQRRERRVAHLRRAGIASGTRAG